MDEIIEEIGLVPVVTQNQVDEVLNMKNLRRKSEEIENHQREKHHIFVR